MEVTSVTKYVRLAPLKAQDLARAITGRPVPEALGMVQASRRKAAFQIAKTLKSAIANAENNSKLDAETLYVKTAAIEEGPRMKRWWPRSRGMARPVQRRTCHIRITLAERPARPAKST